MKERAVERCRWFIPRVLKLSLHLVDPAFYTVFILSIQHYLGPLKFTKTCLPTIATN